MEAFDNEDCIRYASKVVGFDGAVVSFCPPFYSLSEASGWHRRKINLGDKVVECMTHRAGKSMEVTCEVVFQSRKLMPILRIEYRGKQVEVVNQLLRFVGEAKPVPHRCGHGNLIECAYCQRRDILFLQSQERILRDHLLLPGPTPDPPPVWPPDVAPDQDKPPPTCTREERQEPPVHPEGWGYLRFALARGSSFELTKVRPSPRDGCEEATVFVRGGEKGRRIIALISSCKRDGSGEDAMEGGKSDTWKGRGWDGEVTVQAFDPRRWVAKIHIQFLGPDLPRVVSVVTFHSEPLTRDELRSFLLAVLNGGIYQGDCQQSMIPGACQPFEEIRANRKRWSEPGQDLVRWFLLPPRSPSGQRL
jgi:hypothetical protein